MQSTDGKFSAGGWLFVAEDSVPERWRSRAQHVWLVPLLPNEMADMLAGLPTVPEIDPADERLAGLVATGLSIDQLADELSLTARSVRRRLAQLREVLEVDSNAELATLLAKRGF